MWTSIEGLISVIFDITSMKNASIHKYVYIDVVILRVHLCILTDAHMFNEMSRYTLT